MKKILITLFILQSIFSCNNSSEDEIKDLKEIINKQNELLEQQLEDQRKATFDTDTEPYNPSENNENEKKRSSHSSFEKPNNLNTKFEGDYPEGSSRYLEPIDLENLSAFELKVMRNEIFARHGYIFKTVEMKNHFINQYWYKGRYNNVDKLLSNIEKENILLIKSYE